MLSPAQLLRVLDTVELPLGDVRSQSSVGLYSTLSDIIGAQLLLGSGSASYDHFLGYSGAVVQLLKLSPGDQALVTNGRVSIRLY